MHATVDSNEDLLQLTVGHAWFHSSFSSEYVDVDLARADRLYPPIQQR